MDSNNTPWCIIISEKKDNVVTNVFKYVDDEERYNKPYLYSYPNSSVGNEELGTGKNPKSLTWPFGSHTTN